MEALHLLLLLFPALEILVPLLQWTEIRPLKQKCEVSFLEVLSNHWLLISVLEQLTLTLIRDTCCHEVNKWFLSAKKICLNHKYVFLWQMYTL